MKEGPIYVGIDISKLTLDICTISGNAKETVVIKNQKRNITTFFKQLADRPLTVCMENTGRYGWCLLEVLQNYCFKVYVVSPLHLSKSLGLTRGKSDRIDAKRIARFAIKNHSEMKEWKPSSPAVQQLGVLLSERRRTVKLIKQTKAQIKEADIIPEPSLKRLSVTNSKALIATAQKCLKKIETAIRKLIKEDQQLNEQANNLQSVPGIGPVACCYLLVKTKGFSTIRSPRQFACYAGVAPFEHTSGTSVRGKSRVSAMADKEVKTVLHMAALRAVRLPGELQEYYHRKVGEGKNKMAVLNAVRNKLIHRAFAVIRDNRTYQNNPINHLELS